MNGGLKLAVNDYELSGQSLCHCAYGARFVGSCPCVYPLNTDSVPMLFFKLVLYCGRHKRFFCRDQGGRSWFVETTVFE